MKKSVMRWAVPGVLGCLFGLVSAAGGVVAQASGSGEDRVQSSVTLSSASDGRSELWVRGADGGELEITFSNGAIAIDGAQIGAYELDGVLADGWREFLRTQAGASGRSVREGLREFLDVLEGWGGDLSGADAEAARALGDHVARFLGVSRIEAAAPDAPATIAGPDGSPLGIAPGGVGFDELVGQLDRLREALRQLGETGAGAADRLALIVHDDYAIAPEASIAGNLALLDGTLRLGGRVAGDVLILDGGLVLLDEARIDGDVLQVGGDLDFDGEAAVIAGEILSDFALDGGGERATVTERVTEAPTVATGRSSRGRARGPFARLTRNFGNAGEGIMSALSTLVTLGVLGLLLVYFAQGRLEMVADTVRHEFARSFAMGLAGQVLFFPALLVLAVLVITLPVLPFFVLATAIAMVAGYLAVAHGAGEAFAQRRYRYEWLERLRRSNSYYYVSSGLVLLLLPFAAVSLLWVFGGAMDLFRGILYFVACVGTWVLVTAGFGGVLLTRGGSRSVVVDWSAGTTHETGVAADGFMDDGPADAPERSGGSGAESSEATSSPDEPADA